MAKGSSKKSVKSGKASSFTTTSSSSTNTSAKAPPTPFEPAPAVLSPLTKHLPQDHVFVLHVEQTPSSLRQSAFLVPVFLNIVITLGLCWRLYYAAPIYLEQIVTILGYETSWSVEPQELEWSGLASILVKRTFLLSTDFVIFGFIGRWPWEFLLGDKYGRYVGCAGWKWKVGFNRPKEVVVRRGRKWDAVLFQTEIERKKQGKADKSWTKEEELTTYTKCVDGLRKTQTAKNALSLLDRDWDLDYAAMLDATELVEQAEISTDDIDHCALVPWHGSWYSWYPHQVTGADGTIQQPKEEDEQLEVFKKQLIDINCEDIFYRWVEIVQYETNLSTGFTPAKRKEAEQELRRMLKARKQNDDAFLQSIGGTQAVPGLTTGR